ncbi:unnamed protein product [Closterium sp. Yama58-4]|nr:unnamed protein product [Closterium sp. Yama58-4]
MQPGPSLHLHPTHPHPSPSFPTFSRECLSHLLLCFSDHSLLAMPHPAAVPIPASLQPLLESHLLTAIRALPALSPVDPDSLKAAQKQSGAVPVAVDAHTAGGRFVAGAVPMLDERVHGTSTSALGIAPGAAAAAVAAAVHALVTGEVHMTAARTVPIRFHQIDSLLSLLRLRLKPLKRFHLHLDKWTAFVNDEKTRSFLALEGTREGVPEFTSLVQCIDQAYAVHGLPPYYDNPRPHVSLLWVAAQAALKSFLAAHEDILSSLPVQLPEPITLGEGPGIGLARGSQVVSPGSDWSLGDLVKYGADHSHAATSVVVRLREELARVTSVPTMIAVDEFNAWFTFSGFFESTGDRSRRQIHAGEMRMVNAFRSLEATGIMAAAFSESIAVGRLPAVLPGVPKGVRLNVPRFTVDETLALLQHYQKSCKLGRVTDDEEAIKEAAVRACMVTGGNAAQLRNIRHGQAVHNLVMDTEQYKLEKFLDCPLSTQGFEQVAELRKQVAANPPPGFPADLIVVSPLLRTLQTAEGAFGPSPPSTPDSPSPRLSLPALISTLQTAAGAFVYGAYKNDPFPPSTLDPPSPRLFPPCPKQHTANSTGTNGVEAVVPATVVTAAVTLEGGNQVTTTLPAHILANELCRETLHVHVCDKRRPIREKKDLFPSVDFSQIMDDEDALWKVEPRETREEIAQRATDLAAWLLGLKEQSIAVVSHSGFLHAFATVGLPAHLRPENKLVYFENCRLRSYILSAED